MREPVWPWVALRGDGTDSMPALGRWFEAKRLDGAVERKLCVTTWCQGFPAADYFRHGDIHGNPRPHDLIAIRFYDNAPPATDAAKREGEA